MNKHKNEAQIVVPENKTRDVALKPLAALLIVHIKW